MPRNSLKHRITSAFIFLILSSCGLPLCAQEPWIDSCKAIWNDDSYTDSIRTQTMSFMLWNGYIYYDADSAIILAKELRQFGESRNYRPAQYEGYYASALANYNLGNYKESIRNFKDEILITEQMGIPSKIAGAYGNLGIIYAEQGKYPLAYMHMIKADKIDPPSGANLCVSLNNIGNIFDAIGEKDSAMKYWQQSLDVDIGEEEYLVLAHPLANLSGLYKDRGQYAKALSLLNQALQIYTDYDESNSIAKIYMGLAEIFQKQGRFEEAESHFIRAKKTQVLLDDKLNLGFTQAALGKLYFELEKPEKAIIECSKGEDILNNIGAPKAEMEICECLYSAYKELGNSNEALRYHEKLQAIKDSTTSPDILRKVHQMEFSMAMLQDSLARVEEVRAMKTAHQAKLKRENNIRNWTIAAPMLLALLLWGIYNRLKKARTEKLLTEEKIDRLLQFEQLRKLDMISEGQELERKRIAEDLHDKIGGKFSALRYTWSTFYSKELPNDIVDKEQLKLLNETINSLSEEITHIARETNRSNPVQFGLKDSLLELKYLVESSQKTTVNAIVSISNSIPKAVELEVYKIVLELVGNALKYARASEINVQLTETDKHVILMVEDDGMGFGINKPSNGMGLQSVKDRTERLGGVSNIDSKPGKGTTIVIEFDV